MAPEHEEYEPEPTPEYCCTCEHYEFDPWYPGERICDCPYSYEYGLSRDKYDRCDWWEERHE